MCCNSYHLTFEQNRGRIISMEPKRYTALHITPGLVDYTEEGQRETVLIKKEALDKMNRSFLGKPVFNFIHKIISPDVAFDFTGEEVEKYAVGIVSEIGYDVESGYYTVNMMVWDEKTQENIDENGFNVSCAYVPETIDGGIYNNVPYDEEVIDGEYHHMAIVEDPRYGDARIFANSKNTKYGGVMSKKIKLLNLGKTKKQRQNMVPDEKKETETDKDEMSMNMDSVLVDEEGNEFPVSELVENYKASMKENMEKEETVVNMEDTISIDGKEVSMKDLYDNYRAKENAEPPTDEPLEDVVDQTMKENSLGDNDGDKKTPNANFKKLKVNASQGMTFDSKPKVETQRSRIERGKNRYGSAVHNGGTK